MTRKCYKCGEDLGSGITLPDVSSVRIKARVITFLQETVNICSECDKDIISELQKLLIFTEKRR